MTSSEFKKTSEKTEITRQEIGYRWHITIDNETVTPVEGSRASNKQLVHSSLEGHEDTYEKLCARIKDAKSVLREVTKQ